MSEAGAKTGSVVVLGVKGSGKTVFLSILGKAFETEQAFGLNLTGKLGSGTSEYVREAYDKMSRQNEWPNSTIEGTRQELSWTVRSGKKTLFTIQSIDCAGEQIVQAFTPKASDGGKKRRRKAGKEAESKAEVSGGAGWEGEDATQQNDIIDLIVGSVEKASVICLFVNPADFEKYIRNKEQSGDFATQGEIHEALKRSADMMCLLQTFLEHPMPDDKKIIVAVTQTGRKDFVQKLGEVGNAKSLLLDYHGQLGTWEGFENAHVIAVSAVNNVVCKGIGQDGKHQGLVVLDESTKEILAKSVDQLLDDGISLLPKRFDPDDRQDQAEVKEIQRLEKKIKVQAEKGKPTVEAERELAKRQYVWIDKRGNEHAKVRDYPKIDFNDVAASSTGLVEFLLAVGGPLCGALRDLNERLHSLRNAQYGLFAAKSNEYRSARERFEAAETLRKEWDEFETQVKMFLSSHRDAEKETRRYLDEEYAKVVGWLAEEEALDETLKEAARSEEGESIEDITKKIDKKTSALVIAKTQGRPHVLECYKQIASGTLSLTQQSVRKQLLEREIPAYRKQRETAKVKFDSAISQSNVNVAREALGQFAEIADQNEVEALQQRLEECILFINERNGRAVTITEAKRQVASARAQLNNAEKSCESLSFAKARDAVALARQKAGEAGAILGKLGTNRDKFNDGGTIDRVREDLGQLESDCQKVAQCIDGQEAMQLRLQDIAKADAPIRLAQKQFESAQTLREQGQFAMARGQIVSALLEADKAKSICDDLDKDRDKFNDGGTIDSLRKIIEEFSSSCEAENMAIDTDIRNKRVAWGVFFFLLLFGTLGGWLKMRSDAAGQMRGDWADALGMAKVGQYGKATDVIAKIQDNAAIRLRRASIVDEDLAKRIALGARYAEVRDKAVASLESLNAQQDAKSDEMNGELKAKLEKANAEMPKCELDAYGLPRTFPEMTRAVAAYGKVHETAEELQRQLRMARLKGELIQPPQGWATLANALPPDGIDGWLDLADDELSRKRASLLATGLDAGAETPVLDGEKAKAAFEAIRREATSEEWQSSFAPIETACLAVVDAVCKIDEELSYREKLGKALGSAKTAVDNHRWQEAGEFLDTASDCLFNMRGWSATASTAVDSLRTVVKGGIAEDNLAQIEELIRKGELRLAATYLRDFQRPAEMNDTRVSSVQVALDGKLKESIFQTVTNGAVRISDFQEGSRLCLDFNLQSVRAALDDAVDNLLPKRHKIDFRPNWRAIDALVDSLTHAPEFAKLASVVEKRRDDLLAIFLDAAESEANKARKTSSIKDRLAHVQSAETLLARVREEPLAEQRASDIRGTYPAILLVSLVDADGTTPLDAAARAHSPSKKRRAPMANGQTGKNDIIVSPTDDGAMVPFIFDGEQDSASLKTQPRMIQFSWHGIRHVRMSLGANTVIDLPWPPQETGSDSP